MQNGDAAIQLATDSNGFSKKQKKFFSTSPFARQFQPKAQLAHSSLLASIRSPQVFAICNLTSITNDGFSQRLRFLIVLDCDILAAMKTKAPPKNKGPPARDR